MFSRLHQPVKATLLIALLAFLAATAESQTILSSGQLATCVNDGTVSPCAAVVGSASTACHSAPSLLLQAKAATLTCSQKLIVNLVIAAGSNLVTESLDFTVPCIGRYGSTYTSLHDCTVAWSTYSTNDLHTMPCITQHVCACFTLLGRGLSWEIIPLAVAYQHGRSSLRVCSSARPVSSGHVSICSYLPFCRNFTLDLPCAYSRCCCLHVHLSRIAH